MMDPDVSWTSPTFLSLSVLCSWRLLSLWGPLLNGETDTSGPPLFLSFPSSPSHQHPTQHFPMNIELKKKPSFCPDIQSPEERRDERRSEQAELLDPHVTTGWGWGQWSPRLTTPLDPPPPPQQSSRGPTQRNHQVNVRANAPGSLNLGGKMLIFAQTGESSAGREGDKSCCRPGRQWCWSWGEQGGGIGIGMERRGADSGFQLSAQPTGWKVHLSAAILSVCLSLSLSRTVSPPSPPPVTIIPIFSHFLCPPPTTLPPPSFCIYCRIYFCWKVSLVHLLVS